MDGLLATRLEIHRLADELAHLLATARELLATLERLESLLTARLEAPSATSDSVSEVDQRADALLDAKSVAGLLGVHPNWVYAEAAAGRLPSVKIGGLRRFRRTDLDQFLDRHAG